MRFISLGLLLAFSNSASAQMKELPKDTFQRKDQILKRFADEFIAITPGKGEYPANFMMGTPKNGWPNEAPAHKVTFAGHFAICKYEVTQELYLVVIGHNPAKWKGPRNSVEMVSWHESREFCEKAAAELRRLKLLGDDEVIRLPTEAEWEYCCRAGTTTAYAHGDGVTQLGQFCWYRPNSPGNDPPVGAKRPNPWGLYDMHGYISEWCEDTRHDTYDGAPADGSAWFDPKSEERMIRGGSYFDPADLCRSAAREARFAEFKSDTLGIRCIRSKKNKGT